jgi:hypothetical protein
MMPMTRQVMRRDSLLFFSFPIFFGCYTLCLQKYGKFPKKQKNRVVCKDKPQKKTAFRKGRFFTRGIMLH